MFHLGFNFTVQIRSGDGIAIRFFAAHILHLQRPGLSEVMHLHLHILDGIRETGFRYRHRHIGLNVIQP